MLQIFCFAPSRRPLIEPVVSSTNATSTCGRTVACCPWLVGGGLAGGEGGGAMTLLARTGDAARREAARKERSADMGAPGKGWALNARRGRRVYLSAG